MGQNVQKCSASMFYSENISLIFFWKDMTELGFLELNIENQKLLANGE